ncbi:hypothetical protein H4582DRAFT_369064 [Lactarius indigo]|nr:hypothetical protein H4582DRAFT_369064 [Lactarius indigo]
MHRPFPVGSWEDLRHPYGPLSYLAFLIRHCKRSFCQQVTSSSSAFTTYPRLATFPKEMVVGLAALPRLEDITVEFQSATSRPDRIHPPPITRTVLPALTFFRFVGASEYLEDLVSQIDGPQLDGISIVYLNQLVDFQAAQLSKFIDRSVGPKFTTIISKVQATFFDSCVTFDVYRPNHPCQDWRGVSTTISCEGVDWQVSHMAQMN